MQFSVYAPYRGVTGYDFFCRTFLKEWYYQGHKVALQEFERWSNTRGATEIDPILKEMEENNSKINPEFHINFCLLDQCRINPHTFNCCYTMFEADKICEHWVKSAERLDAVFVPTNFSRDVFIKSGIPADKVIVCPIPLDVDKILATKVNLTAKDFQGNDLRKFKHRFLNISEYVTRKNTEGLLQAWVDETKPEDDACLILKLNSNLFAKTDFFSRKLQNLIKNKKCAPIFFFNEFVNDSTMLEFYNLCTHYVTASFGEGWGMSESICAVLGKKLIAPNSSAFTDYFKFDEQKKCTNGYPVLVQASGAKQSGPTEFYYYNTRWWIPIQFDLRKKIRASIKEANEGNTAKEQLLSEQMKDKCHSLRVSGNLLSQIKNFQPVKQIPSPPVTDKFNWGMICKTTEKCGIADYSKMLFNGASSEQCQKLYAGSLLIGGEAIDYRSVLDKYNLNIINIQLEYQFISPSRLNLLIKYLQNSKIVPVVTLHTVNPRAFDYHEVLAKTNCKVIVSSNFMKDVLVTCGIKAGNISVLPMGISTEHITEAKPKPDTAKFRIGFFGFCYPHKGIDKLLKYISLNETNKEMLVLSTKPTNDSGYFPSLVEMFKRKPLPVAWAVDYLDESAVVDNLSSCDLIFLPYSEYGGYGVSAAVRTCLKAGVPIAAFENSFFNDVVSESGLIKFVGKDPDDYENWSVNLTNYINELKGSDLLKMQYTNKRNEFVQNYNWIKVADKYVQLLDTLVRN